MLTPTSLLSVTEALARLLAVFTPLPVERVPVDEAVGRVLGAPVYAPFDLPRFDNSSMDGFAVRAADIVTASPDRPVLLKVVADIPAGSAPYETVNPGQAARIMTGAMLPPGADAIIPVEDTDFSGLTSSAALPNAELPGAVQVYRSLRPGDYVRSQGEDAHAGEYLLKKGRLLGASEIGLLAMLGMSQIDVFRRSRLALLSSGDELLAVGEPLRPGAIYNSNAYMLAALAASAGAQTIHLGVASDRLEDIRLHLDAALDAQADVILSTAGVSVGVFDFVRQAVQTAGQLDFWRVNMRPGKPLAFGQYRGLPFIGLPGNPASAYVGFEVFVRPAIARLSGLQDWQRLAQTVELLEPLESDGRESYLRGVVVWETGRWAARLAGHQGSGNLRSFTQANALLIVPSGVKSLPTGAKIDAWILGDVRLAECL